MYVFELEFRLPKGAKKTPCGGSPFRPYITWFTVADAVKEGIGLLLAAWEINGQILGREEVVARVPGGYRVFVRTPARDALARRHHSDFARQALGQVASRSMAKMKVRRIGRVPYSFRECPGHPEAELILFADVYSVESPLRCAECFGPVPLYAIPPGKNGDRQEITWWASGYRDCDGLLSRKGAASAFARNELEKARRATCRVPDWRSASASAAPPAGARGTTCPAHTAWTARPSASAGARAAAANGCWPSHGTTSSISAASGAPCSPGFAGPTSWTTTALPAPTTWRIRTAR